MKKLADFLWSAFRQFGPNVRMISGIAWRDTGPLTPVNRIMLISGTFILGLVMLGSLISAATSLRALADFVAIVVFMVVGAHLLAKFARAQGQ